MSDNKLSARFDGLLTDLVVIDNDLQNALAAYAEESSEDNQKQIFLCAFRLRLLTRNLSAAKKLQSSCRFFDPNQRSSTDELFVIPPELTKIATLKGLRIAIDLDQAEDLCFTGSIEKFRIIFEHIIEHCIDHTNQGSILVQVMFSDRNSENKLQVTITDTSAGLNDTQIQQIFDQAPDNPANTIPLPSRISLELAGKHLAEIGEALRCQSNVGVGTSFRFELPVTAVEQKDKRTDARDASSMKVLVVEDNEINANVVVKTLAKLGIHSKTVHSGQKCLEVVAQERFDIILMDCHMPGMDGFETTEEIRLRHYKDNHYIVALTADAMPGIREHCLEAGMDAYEAKPLRKAALIALVDTYRQKMGSLALAD